MIGKLYSPSDYIKDVDSERGVLFIEDPAAFNDPDMIENRKKGWKIQARIPM